MHTPQRAFKAATRHTAMLLQVVPDKTFNSMSLCRALFEVWLGEASVIPDVRHSMAAGVAQLTESDEVARGEWKPGGRGTDVK